MMTDDCELIRRVLKGEASSFRALVEKYEGPLFGYLRNLLPDRGDCEDLAQEVFLSAYRNLATYRPELVAFLHLAVHHRPQQESEPPAEASPYFGP